MLKIVYIIAIVLFFSIPYIYKFITVSKYNKDKKTAIVCDYASISSKRMAADNVAFEYLRDGGWVYYATFLTEQHGVIELRLSRSEYNALPSQGYGQLSFREKKFVRFDACDYRR